MHLLDQAPQRLRSQGLPGVVLEQRFLAVSSKDFWQFLAKLTIAAQTWGEQEVYGALTDALTWYFFKVTLLAGDKWVVEAALPMRLVNSVFGATCHTTATITMLLQAMYPSKHRFQLANVTVCNKSDPEGAQAFTEQAGEATELQTENQKLRAESQRLDAEIAILKAELTK